MFSDQSESPMYETVDAEDEDYETLEIDQFGQRDIRYIRMRINEETAALTGIALMSSWTVTIAEETWSGRASDKSEVWTDLQEVPEGQRIIGLKTDTTSTEGISSLAFITAEPN